MTNQYRSTLKKHWSEKSSSYSPLRNNSEHFPLWGPIGFLHQRSSGWEPAPRDRTTPSPQSPSVQRPEWCHCSWQELACPSLGQSGRDTKTHKKNDNICDCIWLWSCSYQNNCAIPTAVSKYFYFFFLKNLNLALYWEDQHGFMLPVLRLSKRSALIKISLVNSLALNVHG